MDQNDVFTELSAIGLPAALLLVIFKSSDFISFKMSNLRVRGTSTVVSPLSFHH